MNALAVFGGLPDIQCDYVIVRNAAMHHDILAIIVSQGDAYQLELVVTDDWNIDFAIAKN